VRMFAALGLALAFAQPVSARAPGHIWTVSDLTDEQMRELDGKIIFVRGWINGCDHRLKRGFDCNVADRSRHGRRMNLGGLDPVFRGLRAAAGHEAILRVRVVADCHHPESSICLENSTDLVTLSVVRIIPHKRS
jgi:hypothetical protein